ncbi:MAG: stage II sporulation protein R [Ruminococcaceae bacterium]|nr:stage II sporulation protein R [Oscillospiraceae bacterium]
MSQKLMAVAVTLCLLFTVLSLLPIHGEDALYANVLRLHVLANSDTEEDQALKLKVRDAVLKASEPILADASSRDEALRRVSSHLPLLEAAAKEAILAAGRTDSVHLELGEEVYPTRSYESFCFPSGSYTSLRVIIGEGEGQNWWCVLFPPMCLSAASKPNGQAQEDAYISVGLTGEQYRMITQTDQPTYSVRFRLLEVIEESLR